MDKTARKYVEGQEQQAPRLHVQRDPLAMVPMVRHVEEREPRNAQEAKAQAAWYDALPAVLPKLEKSSQGHGYKYAALNDVLAVVKPVLAHAGFRLRYRVWSPTSDSVGVRCILRHREGWYETAELICKPKQQVGGRMNGVQAMGSFVTYACRYTLLAVLGTTADVDTDAAAGDPHGVYDEQGRRLPDEVAGTQTPPAEWSAVGPATGVDDDDLPFATCDYASTRSRRSALASMPSIVW